MPDMPSRARYEIRDTEFHNVPKHLHWKYLVDKLRTFSMLAGRSVPEVFSFVPERAEARRCTVVHVYAKPAPMPSHHISGMAIDLVRGSQR